MNNNFQSPQIGQGQIDGQHLHIKQQVDQLFSKLKRQMQARAALELGQENYIQQRQSQIAQNSGKILNQDIQQLAAVRQQIKEGLDRNPQNIQDRNRYEQLGVYQRENAQLILQVNMNENARQEFAHNMLKSKIDESVQNCTRNLNDQLNEVCQVFQNPQQTRMFFEDFNESQQQMTNLSVTLDQDQANLQAMRDWRREEVNDQPVIGIVSQNVDQKGLFVGQEMHIKQTYKSFISSGIVKYIEAQGARVVPLVNGESQQSLEYKLQRINGVVFPGGNHKEADFGETGKYVFDYAKKENDRGNFFPMWGISLGFLKLIQYSLDSTNQQALELLNGSDRMAALRYVKLIFTCPYTDSNIFRPMESQAGSFALGEYVYNHIKIGLFLESYRINNQLSSFWHVTSVQHDTHGKELVSTIEAQKYPFMGTVFSPELQWMGSHPGLGAGLSRSWEQMNMSKLFGDSFLKYASQNGQHFASFQEFQQYSIHQAELLPSKSWVQDVYLFQ